MKCLVVIAHPLRESLCHFMAAKAVAAVTAAGHEVLIEDLYASEFAAELTVAERASYYGPRYDAGAVQSQVERLLWAEGLILCFPTWWFGFPAILKGWFDRVWGPGIAYDHASDLGLIQPRLHGLRKLLVITSLGSPWWVDRMIMRQPVKRVLKTAILASCAPACHLEMLSLYKSERWSGARCGRFAAKVERALARWA